MLTPPEWVLVLTVTVAVLLFPKASRMGDGLGRFLDRFRKR